ncbi:hypothetical protein Efla_005689 [Eimeria flavescens]
MGKSRKRRKQKTPVLKRKTQDGIVGLGFENNEIKERGVLPFVDRVVASGVLKQKHLAVYPTKSDLAKKENPQEEFRFLLEIFGIGEKQLNNWVAVDPANSYWTVNVLSVRKTKRKDSYATRSVLFAGTRQEVSDSTLFSSSFSLFLFLIVCWKHAEDGGASIVDTGTYLIYAPSRVMDKYLAELQVSSCDDRNTLPGLVSRLIDQRQQSGSSVVELQLDPNDYVLEFIEEDGTHECMMGITADDSAAEDGLKGWTFGQVFLRAYYTIFDRDDLALGFVRAKH